MQVGLSICIYIRHAALLQFLFEIVNQCTRRCGGIPDDNGNIYLRDDFPRFCHPHLAEFAFVVKPGSVDNHHRPERQQFHSLAHGVGGSAFYIAHER